MLISENGSPDINKLKNGKIIQIFSINAEKVFDNIPFMFEKKLFANYRRRVAYHPDEE